MDNPTNNPLHIGQLARFFNESLMHVLQSPVLKRKPSAKLAHASKSVAESISLKPNDPYLVCSQPPTHIVSIFDSLHLGSQKIVDCRAHNSWISEPKGSQCLMPHYVDPEVQNISIHSSVQAQSLPYSNAVSNLIDLGALVFESIVNYPLPGTIGIVHTPSGIKPITNKFFIDSTPFNYEIATTAYIYIYILTVDSDPSWQISPHSQHHGPSPSY